MDVADKEDQDAQQEGDLDDVIDKELQAANPAIGCVETKRRKQPPHQGVQPLHTQDLILNKVPNGSCHEVCFLRVSFFSGRGSVFAAIALSRITGNGGKLLDEQNSRGSALGANAVVGPFAFLSAGDNP